MQLLHHNRESFGLANIVVFILLSTYLGALAYTIFT